MKVSITEEIMKKVILTNILFICALILIINANCELAQCKELTNNNTYKIEQKTDTQQQYEYLIQDTENFRQFIQQERKEHQDFLEGMYQKICKTVGIIAAIFAAILSFFSWKTFKDIKQKVENEIKSKAKLAIDCANEEIEHHLAILNNKIENELSYKNANIFVFDETNNMNIRSAMDTFKRKGIKHIKITSNLDELDNKYCLIICNLDNDHNEITNKIKILIDYMTNKSLNVPIVFYITGRINPETLASCPYYCVPANNSTTLIMHCFTLLKMFC